MNENRRSKLKRKQKKEDGLLQSNWRAEIEFQTDIFTIHAHLRSIAVQFRTNKKQKKKTNEQTNVLHTFFNLIKKNHNLLFAS